MKYRLPLLFVLCALPCPARAGDWPMWRRDAGHSGSGGDQLAPKLYLQWTREYPRQKTGWLDQPMMVHDRGPEPVVLGTTLFLPSARNDTLTAIDTRTGAEQWVFHADGPIRFAPVAWEDRVYVTSDDGYLYCIDAASGKAIWKFRGGPADRRILGNSRLVSTWPARGAPVIADGTVYFAASIWPFMGVFLHAVDARSGNVVWTNDGDGSLYMKQPHNADSFAGVAPQGTLAVAGDKLLVPGGRSCPACYDRKTGKLLHYKLAENSKLGGGPDVVVVGQLVFNGGAVFERDTGAHLGTFCKQLAIADDYAIGFHNAKLRVIDLKKSKLEKMESLGPRGVKVARYKWTPHEVGTFDGPKVVESMARVGFRLYVGSPGNISCIELPLVKGITPATSWQAGIEGTPVTLLGADDRLFAVTQEGRLYCFGPDRAEAKTHRLKTPMPTPADDWTTRAKTILDTTKVRDSYCVAWGVGSGRLVSEVIRQSRLHVIVVERDLEKVQRFRERLIAEGLYGERVAVHHGDPATFALPPYLASLMIAEEVEGGREFVGKAFEVLRPYGGVACLPFADKRRDAFIKEVDDAKLPGARVREAGDYVLWFRDGPLPGTANWTHEHGDSANTRVSRDQTVMAPLGVLWFGGSSNVGILPRHGHGPQPQVIDGRLIIEGVDMLRAVDIYTGRVLWEANLPGLGKGYNVLPHQPGANATGTNYVCTPDAIYVVHEKTCLRLDPATGRRLGEFRMPKAPGKGTPYWGYLNIHEDFLIGGADPLMVDPKEDALPRQLQLWDVEKQQLRVTLEGHTEYVSQVAFSPDGKLLATASGDKTVRLWDVATGKSKAVLNGHEKRVICVAFSPDGLTLASGSDDLTVRLWDLGKPAKPTATLKGHAEPILHVAFSPDGKTLVSGSGDGNVRLWETDTQRLHATFEDLVDDVTCLAFSPDGKTLAAGAADGVVKLWDVASAQVRATLDKHHRADITGIAFSRDSLQIATGSKDRTVQVWQANNGNHIAALEPHTAIVTCVTFGPDGKTVAAGTGDASVKLWDVAGRKLIGNLKGQPGAARSVAFSPDGKTLALGGTEVWSKTPNENLSTSKQLVVMERKTGKVLWTADARAGGFRHNALCLGGGRLFAIDRYSGGELARMKRRGQTPASKARLVCFDLQTGEELWSSDDEVFGTWLSYSAKHDVLVEAGRTARDTLSDEPKGVRAFDALAGKVHWFNKTYTGPAMLHGDMVLQGQGACDLLTGKPKMRADPVTGQPVEWTWTRDYGCNTPAASEHLLTFRSGAAGYFDLAHDGGTGNFGGFRSSCTNNLIVAGGLLNAPDYTRNCTCSYQNQTSLALVPMAEVEIWTKFPIGKAKQASVLDQFKFLFSAEAPKGPQAVRHIGLNLGAPGHRRAPDGRFWLNEYDHMQVKYDQFGPYNYHSSRFTGPAGTLPWVASSGYRGITSLELAMKPEGDGETYTVRLHFADPDNDKPGQRVFGVSLQGDSALSDFDVAKEASGRYRAIVKEFKGVRVKDKLTIHFTPTGGEMTAANAPLLCGVEVVREGE